MSRERCVDGLMNAVNIFILLMIVLLYVVTGTGIGDDAIAALSSGTIYRGNGNGMVALECAVSWDAGALSDMLDLLRERDVRITFFISGEWARRNESVLHRMAEDGHEIGTMGYMPMLDGDETLIRSDLEASAAVISSATGVRPTYYYSGLRDRAVSLRVADELDLTHVLCSCDLLSARGSAEEIAARASERLFDGSIVLFQPTAAAVEALPAILDAAAEQGYAVATVGEVLYGKEKV